MEGEDTFDPSFFGYANDVVEEHVAGDDIIMIKGTQKQKYYLVDS